MKRPSAQRPWMVLLALVAVCLFTLAAQHGHAGHTDPQCWLCAASVGHVGIPAFTGLFLLIAFAIAFIEFRSAGLVPTASEQILSARAPPAN